MSQINNQTQDLYSIELVQDIDHEAAATCSGGAYDPDVILYRDAGAGGANPLAVNASIGDGLNYVGNDFNDVTSSFVIQRGTWSFYRDANYGGYEGTYGPGVYSSLPSGIGDDSISSLYRAG
ncbi:MAG: beta/gamma crystallin-related protein [Nostoc sp.]|uniref:beta/gamma crystallin-related protein n=1 Tax=Nostoc sp. TaxID=1180 RepID=UPI002FF48015